MSTPNNGVVPSYPVVTVRPGAVQTALRLAWVAAYQNRHQDPDTLGTLERDLNPDLVKMWRAEYDSREAQQSKA